VVQQRCIVVLQRNCGPATEGALSPLQVHCGHAAEAHVVMQQSRGALVVMQQR